MNQENEQKLFNRFDFFHPERSIKDSLMAFGFECDDGWYSLIWELCEDIETALKNDTAKEICEICGKPGELNKSGWLSTRCEEHRRNR